MRTAACVMVGELIVLNQFLQLWRRLHFNVRRDRFDRELEEEMRFHLEIKAQERAEPHGGNSAIKHYFRK